MSFSKELLVPLVWNVLGIAGTVLTMFFGIMGSRASRKTGKQLDAMKESEARIGQQISAMNDGEKRFLEQLASMSEAEKRIGEQLIRLEKDVVNLEDATRRNLKGFPEIFARALWLLKQAGDGEEIWYVNLLLRFGYPHKGNTTFQEEYIKWAKALDLKVTKYAEAVDDFQETLMEKLSNKNVKLNLLVLSPSSLSAVLSARLKRVYPDLDPSDTLTNELETYAESYHRWESRGIHKNGLQIYHASSIPIQLLVTRILKKRKGDDHSQALMVEEPKKNNTERKWGCLVFLVGTETLGGVEPRGFYTELDHMAEVYVDFARALIETSGKPLEPSELSAFIKAHTC